MRTLIVGQGLAGSALAWTCHWQGDQVCLIGSPRRPAASQVAAGLVMPISGRKFTTPDRYHERLTLAAQFYERVAEELKSDRLFSAIKILRRFQQDSERQLFLQERYESVRGQVQLQSGPIIEREEISTSREFASSRVEWAAWTPAPIRDEAEAFGYGPTPLIAAMRCYVASRLGDEVELPEELK